MLVRRFSPLACSFDLCACIHLDRRHLPATYTAGLVTDDNLLSPNANSFLGSNRGGTDVFIFCSFRRNLLGVSTLSRSSGWMCYRVDIDLQCPFAMSMEAGGSFGALTTGDLGRTSSDLGPRAKVKVTVAWRLFLGWSVEMTGPQANKVCASVWGTSTISLLLFCDVRYGTVRWVRSRYATMG